jgi:hypothetical protein
MRNVFVDFECWYKGDYTLKKLSTQEYIRDERFKMFGMGYAVDDGPAQWVADAGDDIADVLDSLNIKMNRVICHNVNFDGAILGRHYGLRANRWMCTMGLSRAFLPLDRHGLDYIGQKLFGSGKQTGGKLLTIHDPSEEQLEQIGSYCVDDVEKCRMIWKICNPHMPNDQKRLMHIISRWAVEPILRINIPKMQIGVDNAKRKREATILASGIPEKTLSSNKQFEALLLSMGITPPTKISLTTEEETLAFGKSDTEFLELQAQYPEHSAIWLARLAAKSNIDITRPERMLNIARTGLFPMPLNYWGAHTGRKSGADKLNCQNLPS